MFAAVAACGGGAEEPPLARRGELGSLRDLVLFWRGPAAGGPFFLDRFEATRADFAEFAASPAGVAALRGRAVDAAGEAAVLPMAGVDLGTARAFAAWRHCRLPRADEWTYACTSDGRDEYPWGAHAKAERANTSDLGVFAPLPVGTFESGRSGNGPYDLIGNVAEWTETVPAAWFHFGRDFVSPLRSAAVLAQTAPALAIWRLPGGMPTPGLLVAVAGSTAPREVLGGHYAAAMTDGPQWRAPADHADTIGVRLATTPEELLTALAPGLGSFGAEDRRQLERFCRRGQHAEVLRAALQQLPATALPAKARAAFEALLR